MFGKTSISALRVLQRLARQESAACHSPRNLAEQLGESPSYLAKVVRHLVRSGILESEKGVKGGVRLRRTPEQITLLAVVEACHGNIAGSHCQSARPACTHCGFHCASVELHQAITAVLGRWTLAELMQRPPGGVTCRMGDL